MAAPPCLASMASIGGGGEGGAARASPLNTRVMLRFLAAKGRTVCAAFVLRRPWFHRGRRAFRARGHAYLGAGGWPCPVLPLRLKPVLAWLSQGNPPAHCAGPFFEQTVVPSARKRSGRRSLRPASVWAGCRWVLVPADFRSSLRSLWSPKVFLKPQRVRPRGGGITWECGPGGAPKGRCLEGDALGGAPRLFQIFMDVAKPFSRLFSRASTAQAGSCPACRRASREGERPATPGRSRLVHSSGTGGGGRITSCCLSAGRPATGPSASKFSSLWRGSRNRGCWLPVRVDQDRGAAGGAPVPLSGVAP